MSNRKASTYKQALNKTSLQLILLLLVLLLTILLILIAHKKFNFNKGDFLWRDGKLMKASSELDRNIKATLAILISRNTSRNGTYYQLHILKDKQADYIPVEIKASKMGSWTVPLHEQPRLVCNPADGKARNEVGLKDWKAPYALYQVGSSIAYETDWLSMQQTPLNIFDPQLQLIVETIDGIFVVGELEINDYCRVFVE